MADAVNVAADFKTPLDMFYHWAATCPDRAQHGDRTLPVGGSRGNHHLGIGTANARAYLATSF